jgi:glycosyltransferase involved in cell wall biosynthesis
MHIALGAYLLSGTPGYRQAGIHQYIRALLEALPRTLTPDPSPWEGEGHRTAEGKPDLNFTIPLSLVGRGVRGEGKFTALISPTARAECPIADPQSALTIRAASRSTETPLSRIRVEQFETPSVLRELGANLYHGMAFVAPLRSPCPTVVTVHDLSYITQPRTHKLSNRIYLSLFARICCQRATRVIAVSEWTRHDIVHLLGIDSARVDVIPHGVNPQFTPLKTESVNAFRQSNQISPHSIFFLGSLEPRKNLPALIEAFSQVLARAPDAQLIVGGSPGWKYQAIFERVKALGLVENVRFIGHVPQENLPLWYNACSVFAYPSLYEGFGMPVLEAMACGAPVIASTTSSLPEVVGNAGIMVTPADISGLAAALIRVLTDAELNQVLHARSLQRAAQFTWQRTAELTIATYLHALTLVKT